MTEPYDFTECWPPGLPPDLFELVEAFLNVEIKMQQLVPPFTIRMVDDAGAEKRAELDVAGDFWCPRCDVVVRLQLRISRILRSDTLVAPPLWISIGDKTRPPGEPLHIRSFDGPLLFVAPGMTALEQSVFKRKIEAIMEALGPDAVHYAVQEVPKPKRLQ